MRRTWGIFGHGSYGCLHAFEFEFSEEVLLPDRQHPLMFGIHVIHGIFLSEACDVVHLVCRYPVTIGKLPVDLGAA